MQMLCCCERDGPIRECFAASMVVVFGRRFAAVVLGRADALPPWCFGGCFAAVDL
jgi:hypothetical protein